MAETVLEGDITTNTVWAMDGAPYRLSGTVALKNGAKLTIEPGVSIYMADGANLVVDAGVLNALGTQQLPIKVLSDKARLGLTASPGDWGQWIFNAGSSASRLDYVQIEHGHGLKVASASPVFNYLTLRRHLGAAVTLDHAASPVGVGNVATDNTINGIALPAGMITSNVKWGLKGIPYYIESGAISVGRSPEITAISNTAVEQGRTATYDLTGQRLAGLSAMKFDRAGLTPRVLSASAEQVRFEIDAALNASVGPVRLSLMTDAGLAVQENAFSIAPRQPKLNTLQPGRVMVGQGPVQLELTGDTFSAQSAVQVGGIVAPTTLIDAAHLKSTLPNQLQAGNVPVAIVTANGTANPFVSAALQLIVEPQPLAFLPLNLSFMKGETRTLSLRLTYPAPADVSFVLTSSMPGVVSAPAQIIFPAGSQEQTFALVGSGGGVTVLTASRDGYIAASAQIAVEVPMAARLDPSPLVLAPSQKNGGVMLSLSRADSIPHAFTLALDNTAMATLGAASVTIPAGQVSVPVSILGVAEGYTRLRVTSDLGEMSIPVYISSEYLAMSVSHAPALGVYKQGGAYIGRTDTTAQIQTSLNIFFDQPGARTYDPHYLLMVSNPLQIRFGTATDVKSPFGELFTQTLNLAVGPVVSGLDLSSLPTGQTSMLVVRGTGLAAITQFQVYPAGGVQFGVPEASADGRSLTVPVTVASGTATGSRKIIPYTATGPVQESQPGLMRLAITPGI